MTDPKIPTTKRGQSRYYVHPDTGVTVIGVTSVLNQLPKPFLKNWAAKVVAETAVADVAVWAPLAEKSPGGAVDFLKRAPERSTEGAAEIGNRVHALAEAMLPLSPDELDEYSGSVDIDLGWAYNGIKQFMEQHDPTPLFIEETVWSDEHGYAGSFDCILRMGDENILVDVKTTKSGVHDEVALQLTAYSRADHILNPDGSTTPLPEIHGAAVLHLRPEGWSLVPVRLSDELFDTFLALKATTLWDNSLKGSVIGRPIAGAKF